MNVLTNLLRRVPRISNVVNRNYSKDDFSMKWTRPEKVSCILPEKSGDLGLDHKIDPKSPCPMFRNIPEIENGDEMTKKLFSLEYNSYKHTSRLNLEKTVSLVQKHEDDFESFESKIAKLTSEILTSQKYMEQHPRNRQCKKDLKEKIDKRKKYLKKLRTWDYRRFEWILEKLNLVYKPAPLYTSLVTRKGSITKLAKMHCDKIRNRKLDSYKAELKTQQKDFYLKKAKQLAFIREEEIFCGLKPTISEEEVENTKKLAECL